MIKSFKLFDSKDNSKFEDDSYEIRQIFLSLFEEYDYIIPLGDTDNYQNYITYEFESGKENYNNKGYFFNIKIYVSYNMLDKFESLIPKFKQLMKVLSDYNYYPHILNTYQKKKRFGTELEDYLFHIKSYYASSYLAATPLTILTSI